MNAQILVGEHKGKIGRLVGGHPMDGRMIYLIEVESIGDKKQFITLKESEIKKLKD
jgi:hypothetical protein